MIDPKLIKESPDMIKEMLSKRNIEFPFNELIEIDKTRRNMIIEKQQIRHSRNMIARSIADKKRQGKEIDDELTQMELVGNNLKELENNELVMLENFDRLMRSLPNLLHQSVPLGKNPDDNVVIRKYCEVNETKAAAKDHIDLSLSLDLLDLERAAKISGARFYFLKNELVMMNQALINFALDFLIEYHYTLVQPPYMIKRECLEGSAILDDFKDVIYKIEDEDLYMIGTSEHAIASMHMDEILESSKLPIRYASLSPCFRKEAGAHGKDMKGIFRVHQFEKVEQFVISNPENSWDEHERMLQISENFYQRLGIPHQVVLLCTSDLGKVSSKTYDIEAWMPGQKAYREIVSCSNCTDYQARRLRIRHRDKPDQPTQLVHSLNSTLVATERTLVAIMENYQTESGTIIIPDVLRKYMKDETEIRIC